MNIQKNEPHGVGIHDSLIHVISQKTFGQVFYSNKHKCEEKKHFVKNYFHLKNDKNYVGSLCIKIHFICLLKH